MKGIECCFLECDLCNRWSFVKIWFFIKQWSWFKTNIDHIIGQIWAFSNNILFNGVLVFFKPSKVPNLQYYKFINTNSLFLPLLRCFDIDTVAEGAIRFKISFLDQLWAMTNQSIAKDRIDIYTSDLTIVHISSVWTN
jgi:hypothetical protein